MDNSSPIRFAAACGASTSVDFVIEKDTGEVVARGAVDQPCALIGRDQYCEIILSDPQVSQRHALVQVIGGVPFVLDLESKTGILWNTERKTDGWLTPEVPVSIGPFRIHLTAPVTENPMVFPPGFHPLQSNTELPAGYSRVAIEFRNGKVAQSKWEVNRVLTFVGRSRSCKINLSSDEVSLFHCYFLNTPDGLWLVDLYGRGGITVNDEPVRYCRLNNGDEIRIAKFVMSCQYLDARKPVPAKKVEGAPKPMAYSVPDVPTSRPDELVAAREWAQAAKATPVELVPIPNVNSLVADNPAAVALVHHFTTMQSQMMDQFQQTMLGMMKMFGQAQQQQMGALQQEMDRLTALTEEMQKLQTNMTHQGRPVRQALPPSTNLPAPEEAPPVSVQSADQHFNVFERMDAINQERQGIWQRLLKMSGTKAGV